MPMGGIASHVAAMSALPVVVVPVVDLFAPAALLQRVVVGIDGLPESLDAAVWAARNCSNAHFTAVHALELAPAFSHLGDEPDVEQLYDRARARATERLHDHWCGAFVDAAVPFDSVVEEGGAVEVLLAAVTRIAADLVVVSRRDRHLRTAAWVQRSACLLGWRGSCRWSCERSFRKRACEGTVDAARARDARCMADDFRNCAVVTGWVRCRWKSSALSLDPLVTVLPALSGGDWFGADVSTFVLAAATPDGRAAAKYLAHHSTWSSHARLVVRRRNISSLILVRRGAGPCGSVDDFPKSACARPADSRRVVN